ncbi:tumor necrosis factor alpha-induced protein 8-like protein isoform X1 [Neodiprion lecontei]|uniref:Tumor necrosis factor alpha-induced protein 8-like protein isoform X1 n=2 Tax=Neodiprion lecontei TaxID=441921 RepID=A0ABM3FPQ2_NEOLC|nr:tumor necrosis factor alpha-induced protein 8-like protein isoform X1 [Neodiprion fabricii]XP_046589987.1 tumor necrosis factor alpha-induced protein 8-like protein isoform X1 [Neodiprion lecontei]
MYPSAVIFSERNARRPYRILGGCFRSITSKINPIFINQLPAGFRLKFTNIHLEHSSLEFYLINHFTAKNYMLAWGTAVMELQSWLLYHLVAVTDCNQVMQSAATGGGVFPAGSSGSRARDLGLRAQKKILGRVVSTGAGRSLLIDDATTSLLDNLYRLAERAAKSNPALDRKQPEKLLKNIVKLSIKIGLLQRNQQLEASDEPKIVEIRAALRAVAMAVVSFHELEFSFDNSYLTRSLERCRTAVQSLIKVHLTGKSQDRCDQVFDFLTHPEFLEAIFRQNSELRPTLGLLVSDINKALDAGHL